MRTLTILLFAAATTLLQGCFPLAAVGVGAAALSLDNRRTTGLQVEDEAIEWKAASRVKERFKDAHVNATSYNLTVLLTGEAPTEQARKEIGEIVRSVPNVRSVTNEIVIGGNSSLTARSNDVLISGNVKARLLNNGKVSPNHVKVVTEANAVFLMGIVTAAEGDAAAEIARTTSGVSRVVKVFEIIAKAPQ